MRQVHKLVQDPRLLVRRCMEILSSQLVHDGLSLLHRGSHILTSHLFTLFHCSSSVTCVGVDSSVRQQGQVAIRRYLFAGGRGGEESARPLDYANKVFQAEA